MSSHTPPWRPTIEEVDDEDLFIPSLAGIGCAWAGNGIEEDQATFHPSQRPSPAPAEPPQSSSHPGHPMDYGNGYASSSSRTGDPEAADRAQGMQLSPCYNRYMNLQPVPLGPSSIRPENDFHESSLPDSMGPGQGALNY